MTRINEANYAEWLFKQMDPINASQDKLDYMLYYLRCVRPDAPKEVFEAVQTFARTLDVEQNHIATIQYDPETGYVNYKDEEFITIYRKNTRQTQRQAQKAWDKWTKDEYDADPLHHSF
jgi:hypothetical protein